MSTTNDDADKPVAGGGCTITTHGLKEVENTKQAFAEWSEELRAIARERDEFRDEVARLREALKPLAFEGMTLLQNSHVRIDMEGINRIRSALSSGSKT